MEFIITYILSFFICHFVGDVFYMKSDRGLFSMIGFVPIINVIVSLCLVVYLVYIMMDMFLLDKFRGPRGKHGQYNKIFVVEA